MNNAEITNLIFAGLKSIIEEDENMDSVPALDAGTRLIGDNAVVESIGLVNLISDLEEVLDDEYGYVITIADERAMSREKSPFLDVGALSAYIGELIDEHKTDG
jgi:acyl carrier protein